jgi:KUP system potassium uptake protein
MNISEDELTSVTSGAGLTVPSQNDTSKVGQIQHSASMMSFISADETPSEFITGDNENAIDVALEEEERQAHHNTSVSKLRRYWDFLMLTVGAVGVVYGDITTSPLYTFTAIFHDGMPDEVDNLGSLSMIIYSTIIVICLKYGIFMLEMDNNGEGGVLALTALIPDFSKADGRAKYYFRNAVVIVSLMASALFLATGVIAPPVGVLSAIEGLESLDESMQPWIVPISCMILVALFMAQRFGTAKVGLFFGPIMIIWCLAISIIGIYNLALQPAAFKAFNPMYMIYLLQKEGIRGMKMFAGVILALSGAEPMYGDLGHFGKGPLRVSWYLVAFPAITLCYMGQSAWLLDHPEDYNNVFYAGTPQAVFWPMFILATLGTIIASQAMITGTFSLVSAAAQMDYVPKTKLYYTSTHAGQIYIPSVNWMLMIACLAVTIIFGNSEKLADAFGLAIAAVLVLTTFLYMAAAMTSSKRSLWVRTAFTAVFTIAFLPIMLFFLIGNAAKFLPYGWAPMAIALVCFLVMLTWWLGQARFKQSSGTDIVMSHIEFQTRFEDIPRAPGSVGVFYTNVQGVPSYVHKYVQLVQALPETIVFLQIKLYQVPTVKDKYRVSVKKLTENMFRVTARYGFLEAMDMNIPEVIRKAGFAVNDEVSVGDVNETALGGQVDILSRQENHSEQDAEIIRHRTITKSASRFQLPPGPQVAYYVPSYNLKVNQKQWFWFRYPKNIYIFMQRNSLAPTQAWQIPVDVMIELGTVIYI